MIVENKGSILTLNKVICALLCPLQVWMVVKCWISCFIWVFSVSACNVGDLSSVSGLGRCPGEGNATHSSILTWKITWTEEPDRLQSMGSQRPRHDWVTSCLSFNVSALFLNHYLMKLGWHISSKPR